MLDTFTKGDLLLGMELVLRNGTRVQSHFVFIYEYSDDLKHTGERHLPLPGNPKGAEADVMRVFLPRSGAVLWERKEESPDQTKDRRCCDCARLKTSDLLCARCLRGGHETDVDFYLPTGGHVNEKE